MQQSDYKVQTFLTILNDFKVRGEIYQLIDTVECLVNDDVLLMSNEDWDKNRDICSLYSQDDAAYELQNA